MWADMGTQEIDAGTMRNGIDLARFYLSEAQRLAGAALVSDAVAKAEVLRKWMLSESWGKPWLTVREVVRLGPSRLRESPEAKKAISLLVEHGWLVAMEAGATIDGAKVREVWRIVIQSH